MRREPVAARARRVPLRGGGPPVPIRALDRAALDHQRARARDTCVRDLQLLRDHGVVEVRGRAGVDVHDNIAGLDLAGHLDVSFRLVSRQRRVQIGVARVGFPLLEYSKPL